MARIGQKRFDQRQSSLVSISFFDGFDAAELQPSVPPGFEGREAGAKIFGRLHSDVFFDFGPQDFFVPRGRRPRSQTPEKPH
jgi:hypothetical protein